MSKVKLSQCMIVKNDELNIKRALSWGKGIVSEQIVVDTGSTDRTAEIAEEMGAKVYHFEWNDDYSAAKNFAIDKAGGDWILFLNTDEYILEQSGARIRELTEQISMQYPNKPCTIKCLRVLLGFDGKEYSTDLCERIFTNSDIHYTGAIQETLASDDGRALNIYHAQDEFYVYRAYCSSDDPSVVEQLSRNRKILLKILEENPDNPIALYYLGDHYQTENKWEEADGCYQKSISLIPHTEDNQPVLSHIYIERLRLLDKLNKKEEMLEVYEAAISFDPDYPDYHFTMGFIEYDRGNPAEAVKYMEQSMEAAKAYRGNAPSVIYVKLPMLFKFMVQLANELRDRERVVQYGIFSLQNDKYDEQTLQIFINELSKDVNDDGSGLFGILQQIYDIHQTKDRLLLLSCVKKADYQALEELIFRALTE